MNGDIIVIGGVVYKVNSGEGRKTAGLTLADFTFDFDADSKVRELTVKAAGTEIKGSASPAKSRPTV